MYKANNASLQLNCSNTYWYITATITNMVCTYEMAQKSSNENSNTFLLKSKHSQILDQNA